MYLALIECVPTARPDVVKVALFTPTFVVPNKVVPSKKLTLPVDGAGNTVAAKVTALLRADGLALEVMVVEVGAWVTPRDSVDVSGL